MNKFLHPPMQALKQAARENDATRLEALCDTWSLPTTAEPEAQTKPLAAQSDTDISLSEKPSGEHANETSAVGGK